LPVRAPQGNEGRRPARASVGLRPACCSPSAGRGNRGRGRGAGCGRSSGCGRMTQAALEGKRARTKAQNRAAILDAAREVFAELGSDAAGVRDVIRRTDLASGTFYNYFPDKEAVFRAVLDVSAQEIRRRLRAVRANARSLEAFVGDAYRAWFEFLV